jgi:hypothetical protein
MNEKWVQIYLKEDNIAELVNEGVNTSILDSRYYTKLLPTIYRKDGIGAVLGYHSNVVLKKITTTISKLIFGNNSAKPIEWDDDGTTSEERDDFVRHIRLLQPEVERVLAGVYGGGIPATTEDLDWKINQERSYESRSKTRLGKLVNSFNRYYNADTHTSWLSLIKT